MVALAEHLLRGLQVGQVGTAFRAQDRIGVARVLRIGLRFRHRIRIFIAVARELRIRTRGRTWIVRVAPRAGRVEFARLRVRPRQRVRIWVGTRQRVGPRVWTRQGFRPVWARKRVGSRQLRTQVPVALCAGTCAPLVQEVLVGAYNCTASQSKNSVGDTTDSDQLDSFPGVRTGTTNMLHVHSGGSVGITADLQLVAGGGVICQHRIEHQ